MMKLQLAAAILMAVILATFMNMNSATPCLGEAPPPEHNPQDNNTTDDSVVQKKAYQLPSASENLLYFALGVLIIMVLVSSCHLIFSMACKPDRMQERAFDSMLNDRHCGHQYDRVLRWTREPPTLRFPIHPEISLPLVDIPSSNQVFPQDPFINEVHDNLRNQFEGEGDFAPRHVRGLRAPRRVTISSPCVTGTSHC